MTSDLLRTVTTCLAAVFVSSMLLTAATSTAMIF
jgi:hypothetical protein